VQPSRQGWRPFKKKIIWKEISGARTPNVVGGGRPEKETEKQKGDEKFQKAEACKSARPQMRNSWYRRKGT